MKNLMMLFILGWTLLSFTAAADEGKDKQTIESPWQNWVDITITNSTGGQITVEATPPPNFMGTKFWDSSSFTVTEGGEGHLKSCKGSVLGNDCNLSKVPDGIFTTVTVTVESKGSCKVTFNGCPGFMKAACGGLKDWKSDSQTLCTVDPGGKQNNFLIKVLK